MIVAEVSDQNFIDEDIDGEKTKRAKTQELDAYTTNDQVRNALVHGQHYTNMLALEFWFCASFSALGGSTSQPL